MTRVSDYFTLTFFFHVENKLCPTRNEAQVTNLVRACVYKNIRVCLSYIFSYYNCWELLVKTNYKTKDKCVYIYIYMCVCVCVCVGVRINGFTTTYLLGFQQEIYKKYELSIKTYNLENSYKFSLYNNKT